MSVSTLLLALAVAVLANALADLLGANRFGRFFAGFVVGYVRAR